VSNSFNALAPNAPLQADDFDDAQEFDAAYAQYHAIENDRVSPNLIATTPLPHRERLDVHDGSLQQLVTRTAAAKPCHSHQWPTLCN
jgi:hypothetical protein